MSNVNVSGNAIPQPVLPTLAQSDSQEIVDELNRLAAALTRQGERIAHGEPPDIATLVEAGQTIHRAYGRGLLDPILNVQEHVRREVLSGLLPGAWDLIMVENNSDPAGPSCAEGASVDEFIQRCERRVGQRPSPPIFPPSGRLKPDDAAAGLVADLWTFLYRERRGELLQDAPANLVVDDSLPDGYIACGQNPAKAAAVLSYLANRIQQIYLPDGGRGAAQFGYLGAEEIRRAYPGLDERAFDRVRKALENWRNAHEDEVRMTDEDPESGRRRYFYPAAKVMEVVAREMGRRSGA